MSFHWHYVIFPVFILILTIILIVYFYHRLPADLAYHFKADGSPDKWLSREMTVIWTLVPQILLTLVAGAITWGITKLGYLFRQTVSTGIKSENILSLMGNMVALPQIILCFAMADIFSYNSNQIHLMPIWLFALIVLLLSSVFLGIFFIRTIRQAWRPNQ
ncbi:DUF1648 domain-containing protein [Chloroflexota bacterium]